MAGVLFESLFSGKPADLFKGLKTMVLIKDYDPTMSLASFTPFDSATGNFDPTLTTTSGFVDCGYTDENSLEIDRNVTIADTMSGQSGDSIRKDAQSRSLTGSVTLLGANLPVVHALNDQLPLASVGRTGTAGYQVTPEQDITVYDRTVLFVAVDKKNGIIARALLMPRAPMTKPDKESWNRKTEVQAKFQFDATYDQLAGFPYRMFIDGQGWRDLGGPTATPGTVTAEAAAAGTATLSFAAPASPNSPFVYKVFDGASSTPYAGSVTVGGTPVAPVLTVEGLSAGAHTFKVQAIGSNLKASATTAASNSVTIT